MPQKYTLSYEIFPKIHCFKRTLKGILPRDTLSHNFLINCNTLSHNCYQKRTPCRIIFTGKDTPLCGTSRQVKYGSTPLPRTWLNLLNKTRSVQDCSLAARCMEKCLASTKMLLIFMTLDENVCSLLAKKGNSNKMQIRLCPWLDSDSQ